MDQVVKFIAQAKGEDTVVVFLAAHGISDPIGNYYLVPADASMDDVQAVLDGRPGGKTLIAWQYLFDALRQTAGERAHRRHLPLRWITRTFRCLFSCKAFDVGEFCFCLGSAWK